MTKCVALQNDAKVVVSNVHVRMTALEGKRTLKRFQRRPYSLLN